ncbi:MAG: sporulation membrane protein YtaF [Candidatus Carbobacillus sp.]|nr:sporulation membrane protein YtaF [Candidatus Carbobacillus sp.]
MELWLVILGFTLASSIDNFAVGITYGIRNIHIPILSNALIALIAFIFSVSGIAFGTWIANVLPGILPVLLGSFLLFFIGLRVILLTVPRDWLQRLKHKKGPKNLTYPNNPLERMIAEPERADLDHSKAIGLGEAIILGIALSANALTNGIGAGILFGLSPFTLSFFTALGSFFSVWAGVLLGIQVAKVRIGPFTVGQFGTIISGVLLILIALYAIYE